MPTTDFERFATFASAFSASHSTKAVDGAAYGFPTLIVYNQSTHKLPGGGSVEINTITPRTPQDFAWEVEITINDKADGSFIHLILQRDGSVVETYGKTIIPVDSSRADFILQTLNQLVGTSPG